MDGIDRHKKYRMNNPEKVRQFNQAAWEKKKKTPEGIILANAKRRAKRDGLPFNIELEDIVVPEFCPILDIKLEYNWGGKSPAPNSPSLDKIYPEKGYVKGNVKIISHKANRMKSDLTPAQIRRIWEYING